MRNDYYDSPVIESTISKTNVAFVKSYLWMFLASALTLLSGLFFTNILKFIIVTGNTAGNVTFLIMFIVSFVFQMILAYKINKNALLHASFAKAFGGLMLYSLLTGFTFSSLFIFFDSEVLYQVFGGVAIYFLLLSFITFLFRKSIHRARGFAYAGLMTLLIASIIISLVAIFTIKETTALGLYLSVSIIGVVVFSIITMVDIKYMYRLIDESENKNAASVAGAFSLYLDFINIAIYILRILMILGKNVSRD